MLRYTTISKFAIESGYTEDAIRTKIRDGVWAKGTVVVKAPDGRNLIDKEEYEKWVVMGAELKVHQKAASKLALCLRENDAGKGSRSSPRPLT